MEKLDEKILTKFREEAGIQNKNVKEDLALIRNWVNQQPHLPDLEDDEETNNWLYNFLLYSKNRIEKVKKHLDVYFSYKSLMPEFYKNRNPETDELKKNVKALYLITLPKLTPQGYRVHIFSHVTPDPEEYEPKDFMRRALMMCDWKMKHDLTVGDLIIFDMKNSSLGHWGKYNFTTLSRFVACLTKAYPLKIKGIHFIQAPPFIYSLMNNSFVAPKLKKRIKVHSNGNISELVTEVPKSCLPKELGGTLNMTLNDLNALTYRNITEMKEWFLSNEEMKADESKRSQNLKSNILFGCEGTFKSLNLD